MKILIIANSSVGLVKFRRELIEKLQEKHEVQIATLFENSTEELFNICANIYELRLDRRSVSPMKNLDFLCQLNKLIRQVKPDYIITYTIKPNIYGGWLAKKYHIPYAVNVTGLGTCFQLGAVVSFFFASLYRIALSKASVVFFENNANYELFQEKHIIADGQGCVLHGAGVNLGRFYFCEYPQGKDIHFLFVGRLMKEKGVDELLYAYKKLKQRYPNVGLTVLGGLEENYKDIMEQMAKDYGVDYVGWTDDVRPYIEKCHCVVLPSYHEGMSNTLLEGASMGRPLITCNIHGCLEAVIENESGFLVEPKNKDALLGAMMKFVELPYEEKKRMGLVSRRHMENNFAKEKVIEDTISGLRL